jgi:hypothetical protein
MVYKTTTSIISMPLEISLKEIENQTIKSLNGLIYEDNNLEDDKTEMKIWKNSSYSNHRNEWKNRTVLPLKIWSKFKYGTDFMGLNDTEK